LVRLNRNADIRDQKEQFENFTVLKCRNSVSTVQTIVITYVSHKTEVNLNLYISDICTQIKNKYLTVLTEVA